MQEFDLRDLAWVGGGVLTFMVMMFAYTYIPWRRIWTRYVMSRTTEAHDAADQTAETAVSAAKRNNETAETPQPVGETRAETFSFGETTALARLVAAGKIGLTDAVKIGADAKSGERYQKRSREIKAMVDQLKDHYPYRTPEQEKLREQLQLDQR